MQVLKCGSSFEENVGPQVLEEPRLQQFNFVHELFGCRYIPVCSTGLFNEKREISEATIVPKGVFIF